MTCRRCQGEVGEAQFLDLELTQDIAHIWKPEEWPTN
jgi:hypothetical protein